MQALFQKFLLKAAKQIRQPGLLGSLEYELTPQFVNHLPRSELHVLSLEICQAQLDKFRHTRSVWFVEKEFDKPVTKNVNERSTRPKSLEP